MLLAGSCGAAGPPLERQRVSRGLKSAAASAGQRQTSLLFWLVVGVAIPFLFVMWLGSMSSDADYDVGTYHFEGPKEYFQNGRITFLPHNVYTNFPFLTEMFALLGMVLDGDWYWGAIAGKCALFACAPLTALGLYAAGRRWFSPAAGLLAAVVYLSTPWIDRVTIIALAEGGMTFFLFATLFAAMLAVDRMQAGRAAERWVLMTGLLAGSGMGCKYTGLMQVVIPAAIGLALASWIIGRRYAEGTKEGRTDVTAISKTGTARTVAFNLAVFVAGVALTTGPWLVKNLYFTGNPVYPLAYTIFGGRDWNPQLNAKFVPAHSPKDHRLSDLGTKLVDVAADNDWSSPLLFGLAPLALLDRARPADFTGPVAVGRLLIRDLLGLHSSDRPLLDAHDSRSGLAGGDRGRREPCARVDLGRRLFDRSGRLLQFRHRRRHFLLRFQRAVDRPGGGAPDGRERRRPFYRVSQRRTAERREGPVRGRLASL